ncbi:TBC1 domain family member 13-like isoform X2 [Chenopodium quinoa]|uniref:TBC1 domain family member 13-like isoform X2 n=1 Tax=Chenopodium quinoa TaxID=63459 RepID=UPI000B77ED79|nr:TBC1 domain family member 13-like isoform X2 [Chenopodium quinoa]
MGFPDAPAIRSTVWKLLLGYLPSDRAMWPSELANKRSQYNHFKDDLLMSPYSLCTLLWIFSDSILRCSHPNCTKTGFSMIKLFQETLSRVGKKN